MPTAEQIQHAIAEVHDQRSFIHNLLIDTLGWQIPGGIEEIEDISYGWTTEELGTDDLDQQLIGGQVFQIRPMNENQPWGIFILEFRNEEVFTTGRGLTGPLRKVLRGLVPKRRRSATLPSWEREDLLFICTHNYQHFRFAYFKTPIEKGHAEPLITFGWGPDIPSRTAYENLRCLGWPDEEITAEQWVSQWSQAFDVEKVTKKFYEDYERVFTNLQNQLELAEAEDKKMFAQLLMNRLMFLRFVERKGWLRFGDTQQGPQNYLKELFEAGPAGNSSWYNSRLKVLFFEGMAIPNHQREEIIGQVPYLNGGLFEKTPLDDRVTDIPYEAFEQILGEHGLFYRYNFTVEESTPLDIDVAVDPEMLGKAFEKLVTTRRQKGSYYTPRTVVSFMCRETLKGYLGIYYAPLINEDNVERIGIPEARDLLGRLAGIKVVDPACGSGAYLLGMLHELFKITNLLDTRAETETPRDAYHRKLAIIQNNLYGVDIDEFAINIAHLRLWLSLAVEFDGDEPEPLPNLDLKIECGDSLTAPDPSGAGQMDLIRQQQIRDLERLKALHMNPRLRIQHPNLENEIAELKRQIAIYAHPDERVEGFDWRVEFAEVWSERGGFDIVLANPPYGVPADNSLRNQYFNQRNDSEKGQSKDSYGIFLARGLQLLRSNGTLSYIVSDTWRTIKSHRPLRKRLIETTTVFHVLDLPAWIFDATVNTCVITLKRTAPEENHKLTAGDLRGIEKGNWKALSDNLIAVAGHGPDIQTPNYARYTYSQKSISSYDNLSFFIGSPELFKLMDSAVDMATREDEIPFKQIEMNGKIIRVIELKEIAAVKKGLATGDNRRFYYKEQDGRGNYQLVDHSNILTETEIRELTRNEKLNGVDSGQYEGRFLIPLDKGEKAEVEASWLPNYYVQNKFYIDWSQTAVSEIYALGGMRNPHFQFKKGVAFSWTGFYAPTFRVNTHCVFDQSSSCIFQEVYEIEEILGILASKLAKYIAKTFCDHTVNSTASVIERIVIPMLDTECKVQIGSLVRSIIEHQKQEPQYDYTNNEQKQIDMLLNQSYGLDDVNIREVELWYCRRYSKLAEAQGILAEVKEKYADHLARCQRILEKPPSYWRSNPVLELIAQGESHTLEFKETLEYDVRQNQRVAGLAKNSLKTIAAFLNTDGGTLLIGVSDSGEVKGIARDLQFVRGNNTDGFEQKLRSLLNDHFDPSPRGNVDIKFEDLQEGTVCQIKVEQSSEPVAYDNDFYIRDGNGTRKLEGRDLADWLRQRNNS